MTFDPTKPVQTPAGISLRDQFAMAAPISFDDAVKVYGTAPKFNSDADRAAFLAVWAFLRFEYADAMMKAREQNND